MKKPFVLLVVFSSLCFGCSESPQEKAYDEALKSEQADSLNLAAHAPELVRTYLNVVNLDPKSKWAVRAQNRINLIQGIVQDDQILERAKANH